jgi:DNA-binding protein Fis
MRVKPKLPLMSRAKPGNVGFRSLAPARRHEAEREKIAASVRRGLPSSCSGAMYCKVPEICPSRDHEKYLVAEALRRTDGNQTQAAHLLHTARDTLRYESYETLIHKQQDQIPEPTKD